MIKENKSTDKTGFAVHHQKAQEQNDEHHIFIFIESETAERRGDDLDAQPEEEDGEIMDFLIQHYYPVHPMNILYELDSSWLGEHLTAHLMADSRLPDIMKQLEQ